MKHLLLLSILLCSFAAPKESATSVLEKRYIRYKGHWYKTLKFIQDTEKYRNDSLIKTETWYETMVYPDQFRIDFGTPKNGNAVIFGTDSTWVFNEGKLAKAIEKKNEIIFLLGGMYFAHSFQDVAARLKAMNYDLDKFHTDNWKGKKVYIIGADNNDEQVNQLWLDKDNLNIVRFIKYEDGKKQDCIMENHVPIAGGWTETKVTFYADGDLRQIEKYHDYIANDPIDMRLFNPSEFGKYHWYKD